MFRLREVLTNLLRANFLSYYILADTPESLSISIQGNAIITFVITKDNYITFTITKLQAQFMDLVVEYMEESINWPDPDDQETFEKQLLG